MKTSKKTDYAIHALMILAKRPNQDLSVEEEENVFDCVDDVHGWNIRTRNKKINIYILRRIIYGLDRYDCWRQSRG